MRRKRIVASSANQVVPKIEYWERHTLSDGRVIELPTLYVSQDALCAVGKEANAIFHGGACHGLKVAVARWLAYLNGYCEYGEYGILGRRILRRDVDITSTSGPYDLSRLSRDQVREATDRVRSALRAVENFEGSISADSRECMAKHISLKLSGDGLASDEQLQNIPPSELLRAIEFVLGRSARKVRGERRFAEGAFSSELEKRILSADMLNPPERRNRRAFLEAVNRHILIPLNRDPLRRAPGCSFEDIDSVALGSIDTAMKAFQSCGSEAAMLDMAHRMTKLKAFH